jgi:hypothetical protein
MTKFFCDRCKKEMKDFETIVYHNLRYSFCVKCEKLYEDYLKKFWDGINI